MIPPDRIIDDVSRTYHVPRAQILGRERLMSVALARNVAMYLTYRHCGMILEDVGRLFGRDHSTVFHATKLIGARRSEDRDLDRLLESMESQYDYIDTLLMIE
jgi:chromosomal replication initiator protein